MGCEKMDIMLSDGIPSIVSVPRHLKNLSDGPVVIDLLRQFVVGKYSVPPMYVRLLVALDELSTSLYGP